MDGAVRVQLATTKPLVSFWIPVEPPRSLSKNNKQLFVRDGRACMTDGKATAKSKRQIAQLLSRYRPKEPFAGALAVTIRFCYPFPSGTTKATRELGDQPKVTRPDVDGIASGVLDTMTTLRFWTDDAQVSELTVSKSNSNNPGFYIRIENDEIK